MLKLAVLSLIRRPLRYGLLILLTAVACALPVFVIQLAGGLYQGLNRAAAPFPILAGAKGSPYQLVLNTVFLRDRPIGNIPYGEVETLRQSGKATQVLPLAFGDSYRGFRLCGTEAAIFSYVVPGEKTPWLVPAQGRGFAGTGEAVLGADTARLTGLKVGDVFQSSHGFIAKGKAHNHPYRVVGILAPVHGPYDKAILVPLEDIWEAHAGHGAAALHTGEKGDVTAILVRPKGYGEAMQLLSAWQRKKNSPSQLLFPAQSLIALYGMVGQSRQFWTMISLGLLGAATLVTLLALYWDGTSRLEEWALLRALGASLRKTQGLLLLEQFLLLLVGSTLGWLLGYGGSLLAAAGISQQAAVEMSRTPLWQGFLAPLLLVGAGTLGGVIPLWLLRKKDIAPYL
ncbi:ABC transporter permease [uncultured Acidaminococcus sp.]|uniref:ABC transporter permease n=1 Tax=uncultured Acidaminococcus sp. TaxID=352152 RepID=UPI0029420686|nr:ABC transporter permease [uncultured Acidaminococcus sp.]